MNIPITYITWFFVYPYHPLRGVFDCVITFPSLRIPPTRSTYDLTTARWEHRHSLDVKVVQLEE